jgi:hypothetical protein
MQAACCSDQTAAAAAGSAAAARVPAGSAVQQAAQQPHVSQFSAEYQGTGNAHVALCHRSQPAATECNGACVSEIVLQCTAAQVAIVTYQLCELVLFDLAPAVV